MKQPFSKWYWSDWRGDPKLKLCSLAARGLWMEMLAIMHESEPYGHLVVEGVVPDIDGLAAITGRPAKEVRPAFQELEKWKVFSRDDDGVPFSRRMIRDRAKAETDKANGRKGGNPKITAKDKATDNPSDNGGVNPTSNPHRDHQKPEARSHIPEARIDIQSSISSQSIPDTTGTQAAAPEFHPRYREVRQRVEELLNSPNLHVFGRVDIWLKTGADPEGDIYPTLERLKPRWKGRHLDYFDDAIADAIAARSKPLPQGQAKSGGFDAVAHMRALAEKDPAQ